MRNDGLVFTNEKERVVFHYHSFCEILKGCIGKYCEVSVQEANDSVENCKLFKTAITTVNDVYFFSHEHPFHWAMTSYFGDAYWDKNPELTVIPDSFDEWEKEYIKENKLMEEAFVFSQINE